MHTPIEFWLNGQPVVEAAVSPSTTLLEYLRYQRGLTGTKEGCAEGDCGACTVAILEPEGHWRAINSCLLLLPMVHQRQVVTVEGLGGQHPAQTAMVEALGSQCGYCTPGIVMSLFEAAYRPALEPWQLDDQLSGNLCRCTGYRPIRAATEKVAGCQPEDRFRAACGAPGPETRSLVYQQNGQRFFLPATILELWEILSTHPEARLINGGTDLSLEVTKKFAEPPCLVGLERLEPLRKVEQTDAGWRLGAGVPLSTLEAWAAEPYPPLARMLRFFGARQIKHRATLGGNLCTASPIGDLAPVFLALGAQVVLASKSGERVLPLERFFLGYRKTALLPGEILAAVVLPPLSGEVRAVAYKVSKRQELDISTVSAAFYVRLLDGVVQVARWGFGGMAATPARATKTEAAIVGLPWNRDTAELAALTLASDFQPIDDHRGSAWYRRTVAQNLVRGFYLETAREALPRLGARPTGTVQIGGPR